MRTPSFHLSIAFLALIAAFPVLVSAQQDAEVTFYVGGKYLATGTPGYKHGNFYGAIFDGQQRIAVIRRGRFFTMHFRPGHHVFSASTSGKHPATNSQLDLYLRENEQYFIRVESEARGVLVYDSIKGILIPVSCQTAQQEIREKKPLEEKYVSQDAKSRLLDIKSAPVCSEP